MPNDPSKPPNETYSSTCGADYSSWDGSFTYTDKTIVYTRTNPAGTYNATNKSNGNAIVFDLSDGTESVQFNGPTYVNQNGKAQYSGHCHKNKGPILNQDGWTATQTS